MSVADEYSGSNSRYHDRQTLPQINTQTIHEEHRMSEAYDK